jgi:hypothetical protein
MIQTVWRIQRKYFSIGWFRRPSSIQACSGALGAAFDVAMRALELRPLYRGELETTGNSIDDLCKPLAHFSDSGALK